MERKVDKWFVDTVKRKGMRMTEELAKELWHKTGYDGYLAVEMVLALYRRKRILAKVKDYRGLAWRYLGAFTKRVEYERGLRRVIAWELISLVRRAKREKEPIYLAEVFLMGKMMRERDPEEFEKFSEFLLRDPFPYSVFLYKLLHQAKPAPMEDSFTCRLLLYVAYGDFKEEIFSPQV